MLIPVTHLEARTQALVTAVGLGHLDCVDLLYPVADPLSALVHIQKFYPQSHQHRQTLERMIAQKQNDTLCAALGNGIGHKGSVRKM